MWGPVVMAGRVSNRGGTSRSDRDLPMEQASEPVAAHRLRRCDDSLGLTPEAARFPFDGTARKLCSRKYQFSCNSSCLAGGVVGIVKPVKNRKHKRQPARLVRCRTKAG